MKRALFIIPLLLSAALLLMGSSYDDVSDVDGIEERLSKYRVLYKDDHPAIQRMLRHLEKAKAQKKAKQKAQAQARALAKAFPQPPAGWRALKPRGTQPDRSAGAAIDASRLYLTRAGGTLKIMIKSDLAEAQTLQKQMSDPGFSQPESQVRLIKVQGQKALLIDQNVYQSAELRTLVNGYLLVKVNARNIPGAARAVREFADNIDLAAIRQLSK